MMQRLLSATTVLLSLDSSLAFSTAARRSVITTQPRLMKPLQVGFVLDGDMRRPYYSQEEAYSLMELAYDCASDDSCSIEEADSYLNTIMYVQSDCTSGELVGKDLCENQDHVAEVVAQLRAKIAKANRGVIHHSMKHGGWTASKQLAGLTLVAGLVMMITALMGVLSLSTVTSGNSPLDASPFTTQEWWWAMRDGYLPTMVESYIRNGGLASVASDLDVGGSNGMVTAAASAANVVPFTLQEWGWAMQGGYLPRMMAEQFQQGGFVMDAATSMASSAASSSSQDMATVSLTPQEWMWAAQGGYLDTLVGHVARNGGLATGADVESATPFTVQEWQMAMQGGYLNTMMEHYIRNGGL